MPAAQAPSSPPAAFRPGLNLNLKHLGRMLRGRSPGQLIIQYTDRCNARCPQCEMRVQNDFDRTALDLDRGKKLIDAAVKNGVAALSFTGGEPFLKKDEVLELIGYAGTAGIKYIRTGTNGFMFLGSDKPSFEGKVRKFAEQLAATKLYTFWISIDSVVPEVHEEMRGLPGVLKGVEKALPIFEEYGIYPSANLGINRNAGGDYRKVFPVQDGPADYQRTYDYFRTAFARFYTRAADMGFTIINMCYPMSVDPEEAADPLQAVYTATSTDRIVRFTPDEKVPLFQALYDTVPEHRSKIRIFTPRTSVKTIIEQYSGRGEPKYGCRGGIDYFFVSSVDGNAYPCGYRGDENMGPYWDLDLNSVDQERNCTDCDWECFRDPSELSGPVLDAVKSPFQVAGRLIRDREFTRLWWEDLSYYRACNYFCGRMPPNRKKLERFAFDGTPFVPPPMQQPEPEAAVTPHSREALETVC
ncbi:MAG: radical SAM protein [Planctomycetota bacterium]